MYCNFTKQGLNALPFETKTGKRECYYDTKEPNLYLQVGTKTKTFYLLKKVQGITQKIKIGRFPDISVEKARQNALFLKSQFADGKTFNDIRNAHKKEDTFFDIFSTYMNRPEAIRNKYWKEQNNIFNAYAHPLFKKPFSTVSKKDIKELFKNVSIKTKSQANKLLVIINKMYNKKIEDDELEMLNPASGIKRNPQISRERFLQAEELPKFFKALDEIKSDYFADYVKVSLWTGARRSNVLGMKWNEIDFTNRFWTIPSSKSKNKATMILPLNENVISILKKRKQTSKSIYVFPNLTDPSKHIVEIKTEWKTILTRAGITNLRPHDLRRTFGSYMAISGANLPQIAKALGHKSLQSTEIYARLNIEAVAQSSTQGIDRMLQCLKEK